MRTCLSCSICKYSTQCWDGVTQLSPQAPSGSNTMSDISTDLPQEVLSEILIRLPIKSIGRSRCVSKPWLSLLTSYEFIKAHLAHHTHISQEQKLLLRSSSNSLFSLTLHPGGTHLRELEFFDKQVITLVGSCNGLVLVSTKSTYKWLINCTTEEYVKLLDSPVALCPRLSVKKYGLGYDGLSDDYKIVKISQCSYILRSGLPHCPGIFVDIYSLKTRSWKRLGTNLYGHDLPDHAPCVFLNGAFHWIGMKSSRESSVIVAFDLSSEKFREISGPASGDIFKCTWTKLTVIDGCLGIVVDRFVTRKCEIWLMKSYPSVESWTKLVIKSLSNIRPLCFHEGKMVFDEYGILKRYCLKDGRAEVCDGERYVEGITYSVSLVSPKCSNLMKCSPFLHLQNAYPPMSAAPFPCELSRRHQSRLIHIKANPHGSKFDHQTPRSTSEIPVAEGNVSSVPAPPTSFRGPWQMRVDQMTHDPVITTNL